MGTTSERPRTRRPPARDRAGEVAVAGAVGSGDPLTEHDGTGAGQDAASEPRRQDLGGAGEYDIGPDGRAHADHGGICRRYLHAAGRYAYNDSDVVAGAGHNDDIGLERHDRAAHHLGTHDNHVDGDHHHDGTGQQRHAPGDHHQQPQPASALVTMVRASERSAPQASPARSRHRYLWWPPRHWAAFVLLLTVGVVALILSGIVNHRIGRSSTARRGVAVAELARVGPIADFSGADVLSASPPNDEVALTFDDGPDPHWTPQLLDLLARRHVHATFFVVGSQVVSHPGLVRRELRDGHGIGSHTFTHADLGQVSGLRADFELALTQTELAGAVGRNATLLRLPYSSSLAALDDREYRAARAASRFGYVVVGATNDSEDWRRPGTDFITTAATPSGRSGAIILMHDAGGDRSETLAAVDRLITSLQARGDRFVTVSELMGQRRDAMDPKVGLIAHLQGVALLDLLWFASLLAAIVQWSIAPIGVLTVARALLLVTFAHRHTRRRTEPAGDQPPVTVIIPAYNEEVGIEAAVSSIAANDYPDLEIIVVDDGSTDRTADRVRELDLPNVTLITQANAGKPTALNTGLAAATGEIVVMVDGDTVFEPDTVPHLVVPFAAPDVGAVSGNTKVGNRGGLLGRWQHVEYVLGFNLDRRMYDVLRCMPTVPGAIGAFRRSVLEQVGGVSDDTLAEDTDLTMMINRAGHRVVYEERARAWTEAPSTLRGLWRQRYRWCYGTMQSMWKHKSAVRQRSRLGRVALPYLLAFQVALPLIAPLIDLYALYGVVFLDPRRVIGYWLAFNAFQLLLGVYAFRLDRERLGPLWSVPLQQFVYRQLMYLVVYQSMVSAVAGNRLRWHKLNRVGVQLPDTVTTAE